MVSIKAVSIKAAPLKADVFLYDKHAGVLEKLDSGYVFSYLNNYYGPPLSLSMPMTQSTYSAEKLFPFFTSLLPEGWLLKQYTRAQHIDERDEFNLLVNNGEDLLGAVAVRPRQQHE